MIKTKRVQECIIILLFLITNVLKIIGSNGGIIVFSLFVFLVFLIDRKFQNSIISNKGVAVFFILMECSNIIGGLFNTSHFGAGLLYDFCLFCYAVYGCFSGEYLNTERIIKSLRFFLICTAFYGIFEKISGNNPLLTIFYVDNITNTDRICSVFVHPVLYAMFLVQGIVLVLYSTSSNVKKYY